MRAEELNPAPPVLPPEIAAQLELNGRPDEVDLTIRGRGGLFEAEATDLSRIGALVLLPPPKLDRRFEDCFGTGADVRFKDAGFAVRADLVYSVRGIVDRRDLIVAAFRFRRELTPDQCQQLRIGSGGTDSPFETCSAEPRWV